MSPKRAGPDPRQIRHRHEEAIADLVKRRQQVAGEIAALEAKRREVEGDVLGKTLDLIVLLDVLEQSHDDAEWIRRKAAIWGRAKAMRVPSKELLVRQNLPPPLNKELHALVERIQQDNLYAHVTGDFSPKTGLQNKLLESYSELLDIRWDGEKLLLIEYQGRSAGHIPLGALSTLARKRVAKRLGLANPPA